MSKIDEFNDSVTNLQKESFRRSLKLFYDASLRIPAYKEFLKENSVNADLIKTQEDFSLLPTVDKDNYLRRYPLNELCWDGSLFSNNIISSSSGSSGIPFFWPRGDEQHRETELLYSKIYSQTHDVANKSTLLVVCFSMGTWIAGVYTTLGAFGASRDNKLNVITPGIEKDDAISAILGLKQYYDQIIIAGYPPFVKDIIDYGNSKGIDWSDINTKFSFAGEAISEEWRDNLLQLCGNKISPLETVNIYGTADMGVVGFETPLSIFMRRRISVEKAKYKHILVDNQLPTLVQYDLTQKYIEVSNSNLIITANYGVPLIRYDIKDQGGKISLNDLCSELQLVESSFPLLNNKSILENLAPSDLIYIRRRKDLSISFYSLLVYPEHIKSALVDERLKGATSGKFFMKTTNDDNHNQVLEVHLELSPGTEESAAVSSLIKETTISTLIEMNSEYRKLYNSIGKQAASPKIYLYEFGTSEMFKIKNKQKWV